MTPSAPDQVTRTDGWRLFKRITATAALRVTGRGMAVVTTLVLTRTLGADEYGVYAYVIAWATVLAVPGVFGFDRVVVRFVAEYHARSAWGVMRGLVSSSGRIVLVTSVAVAAVAAVAGALLLEPPFRDPFLLGTLLVPTLALMLERQAILQGLGRVELGLAPLFLIWPALLMLLAGAMALADPGLLDASTAVGLNLIAMAIALVSAVILLRRHRPVELRMAGAETRVGDWVRAAAPLAAVAAIYLGGNQIGPILLGSLSEAREVAFFQAPARITELLVLVLMAFNLQLQPDAARLHSLGLTGKLQERAVGTARAALAFALPVGAVLILFREPVLELLGPGFVAAEDVLILMVIAQIVLATTASVSVVLTMTGHAGVCAAGMGAGLAVNATVCAVLIPQMGAEGAAIARILDLLVWNVILVWVARDRLGIRVTAFSRLRPSDHR